jgi:arabinogalactan oligomer / maltooligosaccharide transport system substrate-binding protein
VEVAVPMPNLPEMSMVWSPATSAMSKVNRGAASPRDALGVAQDTVLKSVAGLHKAK